jgi:hypothetical protein
MECQEHIMAKRDGVGAVIEAIPENTICYIWLFGKIDTDGLCLTTVQLTILFNLIMVPNQYAFSRNHTSKFEF